MVHCWKQGSEDEDQMTIFEYRDYASEFFYFSLHIF